MSEYKGAEPVTGFKKFWFLFRFFLIGRMFCDIPLWAKRCWKFVNWLLWFLIVNAIAQTYIYNFWDIEFAYNVGTNLLYLLKSLI